MCATLQMNRERKKSSDFAHQSQSEAGEERGQAEDDVWAPHRNAQLLRHVVMATLEEKSTVAWSRMMISNIPDPHKKNKK